MSALVTFFLSPLQTAGLGWLAWGTLSGPAALHPCREQWDWSRDPRPRHEHPASAGLQAEHLLLVSLAFSLAAGALSHKLVKQNLKHVH